MERELQIWLILITACLALLVVIQISVIAFMVRLSNMLKPAPGRPGLREMLVRVMDTVDAMNRTTKMTTELLNQVTPIVGEAVIVSRRQLAHADQVIGKTIDDVDRINQAFHKIAMAFSFSFTRAHALSAGVRSATATFFRKGGYLDQRERW